MKINYAPRTGQVVVAFVCCAMALFVPQRHVNAQPAPPAGTPVSFVPTPCVGGGLCRGTLAQADFEYATWTEHERRLQAERALQRVKSTAQLAEFAAKEPGNPDLRVRMITNLADEIHYQFLVQRGAYLQALAGGASGPHAMAAPVEDYSPCVAAGQMALSQFPDLIRNDDLSLRLGKAMLLQGRTLSDGAMVARGAQLLSGAVQRGNNPAVTVAAHVALGEHFFLANNLVLSKMNFEKAPDDPYARYQRAWIDYNLRNAASAVSGLQALHGAIEQAGPFYAAVRNVVAAELTFMQTPRDVGTGRANVAGPAAKEAHYGRGTVFLGETFAEFAVGDRVGGWGGLTVLEEDGERFLGHQESGKVRVARKRIAFPPEFSVEFSLRTEHLQCDDAKATRVALVDGNGTALAIDLTGCSKFGIRLGTGQSGQTDKGYEGNTSVLDAVIRVEIRKSLTKVYVDDEFVVSGPTPALAPLVELRIPLAEGDMLRKVRAVDLSDGPATLRPVVSQEPARLVAKPASVYLASIGATRGVAVEAYDAAGRTIDLAWYGYRFQWTSSDASIARVSEDGVVNATKGGAATVRAEWPWNPSAAVNVPVTVQVPAKVAILPAEDVAVRSPWDAQILTVELQDEAGSPIPLSEIASWSSDNPSVLAVSGSSRYRNGQPAKEAFITAVAPGVAKISVSVGKFSTTKVIQSSLEQGLSCLAIPRDGAGAGSSLKLEHQNPSPLYSERFDLRCVVIGRSQPNAGQSWRARAEVKKGAAAWQTVGTVVGDAGGNWRIGFELNVPGAFPCAPFTLRVEVGGSTLTQQVKAACGR